MSKRTDSTLMIRAPFGIHMIIESNYKVRYFKNRSDHSNHYEGSSPVPI